MAALDALRAVFAEEDLHGVYLYGSAVRGGLRSDSDIDLFAVTGRALRDDERAALVNRLVPISWRQLRPPEWRPIELTIVVQRDVRPWRYPPRADFQYGEWMREELVANRRTSDGRAPGEGPSPDLAVLITIVRAEGRPELGPPATELLEPVPRADLVRAMVDEVPSLLDDLDDDTRNVLLTLARMWCTVATGEIQSKDGAAAWAIGQLPIEERGFLERARLLYLEGGYGEWEPIEPVREHAHAVSRRISKLASQEA